ncbi:DUF2516 family protein [Streptomyces sp. NPDC088725]|uniref:DUF2516 family protein n=1 Tax=Streptomyces sp. NPDC088725 TaxID=3365873 RepID=UPI003829D379
MLTLFGLGILFLLIDLAILGLALVALVIAVMARGDAYRAADKKTKNFWMGLLGAVVAVNLLGQVVNLGGLAFMLQIAGLVATIVFMVDVRPAVRAVSGPGRRGGSSSDGPYGPYNGGR